MIHRRLGLAGAEKLADSEAPWLLRFHQLDILIYFLKPS